MSKKVRLIIMCLLFCILTACSSGEGWTGGEYLSAEKSEDTANTSLSAASGASLSPEDQKEQLLKQLEATIIYSIQYADNGTAYLLSYDQEDSNDLAYMMTLSKYNFNTKDITIIFKDYYSLEAAGAFRVEQVENDMAAIYLGEAVIWVKDGAVVDALPIDEAYRRDSDFNFASKALAYVPLSPLDLFLFTPSGEEGLVLYESYTDENGNVMMPYAPRISPNGECILFQVVRNSAMQYEKIICIDASGNTVFEIDAPSVLSDSLYVSWIDDNRFVCIQTAEGEDDAGQTYKTIFYVYNLEGELERQFESPGLLSNIQHDLSHSAPYAVIDTFDSYNVETDTIHDALWIVNFDTGTVKRFYDSSGAIYALDLSDDGELAVWIEDNLILSCKT